MYGLYCDRVTGLEYITMILTYIHNQRNSYLLSCRLVANMCPTLASSWTTARQAPLSMVFFRQEYWSGLPCPPPGDLPHPGMKPKSPTRLLHWQVGSLPLSHLGSPILYLTRLKKISPNTDTITQLYYCYTWEELEIWAGTLVVSPWPEVQPCLTWCLLYFRLPWWLRG